MQTLRRRFRRKTETPVHIAPAPAIKSLQSGVLRHRSTLHGTSTSRWTKRENWYFTLLDIEWKNLIALIVFLYACLSLVLSLISFPFHDEMECEVDDDSVIFESAFGVAFIFASSNILTLGQGLCFPDSYPTFILAIIQIFIGILVNALIFSVFVVKFQLPSPEVIFTEIAIITTRDKRDVFMFRVGNKRLNLLFNTRIKASLMLPQESSEGENFVEFIPIKVQFPLTLAAVGTAVHFIDDKSPLKDMTPAQFTRVAINIVFSALDGVYNSPITCATHYRGEDIVQKTVLFANVMEAPKLNQNQPNRSGEYTRLRANFENFNVLVPINHLRVKKSSVLTSSFKFETDESENTKFPAKPRRDVVYLIFGCLRRHSSGYLIRSCTNSKLVGMILIESGISHSIIDIDMEDPPNWFVQSTPGVTPTVFLNGDFFFHIPKIMKKLQTHFAVKLNSLMSRDVELEGMDMKPLELYLNIQSRGFNYLKVQRDKSEFDTSAPMQSRDLARVLTPAEVNENINRECPILFIGLWSFGSKVTKETISSIANAFEFVMNVRKMSYCVAYFDMGRAKSVFPSIPDNMADTAGFIYYNEKYSADPSDVYEWPDIQDSPSFGEGLSVPTLRSELSDFLRVSLCELLHKGNSNTTLSDIRKELPLSIIMLEAHLASSRGFHDGLTWPTKPYLNGEKCTLPDAILAGLLHRLQIILDVLFKTSFKAVGFAAIDDYVYLVKHLPLYRNHNPENLSYIYPVWYLEKYAQPIISNNKYEEMKKTLKNYMELNIHMKKSKPLVEYLDGSVVYRGRECGELQTDTLYLVVGCIQRGLDLARVCYYSRLVEFVLKECQIEYIAIKVNLKKKPGWFTRETTGKSPNLYFNGKWFPETIDILNLIQKKFASKVPEGVFQNHTIANLPQGVDLMSEAYCSITSFLQVKKSDGPDERELAFKTMERVFELVEICLSARAQDVEHPCLVPVEGCLSFADICFASAVGVHVLHVLPALLNYSIESIFPNLYAYLERVSKRPAFFLSLPVEYQTFTILWTAKLYGEKVTEDEESDSYFVLDPQMEQTENDAMKYAFSFRKSTTHHGYNMLQLLMVFEHKLEKNDILAITGVKSILMCALIEEFITLCEVFYEWHGMFKKELPKVTQFIAMHNAKGRFSPVLPREKNDYLYAQYCLKRYQKLPGFSWLEEIADRISASIEHESQVNKMRLRSGSTRSMSEMSFDLGFPDDSNDSQASSEFKDEKLLKRIIDGGFLQHKGKKKAAHKLKKMLQVRQRSQLVVKQEEELLFCL